MSKDHKNGRDAISAYAEEIKLSRISEGETMADLVATREALEAAKARIAELEGAIRSQPGNMTRQRTEALERSLASWDIGRELVEEVQALQIKLETATAAYTELAAGIRVTETEGGALQQANNEINRLRGELTTATTEIAERDDTIDALRNDIASLRMQLAYATAERDALKAELGPTNRQIHEDAAGMGLEDAFFRMNGIDPDERPGRKVERNAGRVAPVLTGEEGEAKAHALGWDPSLIETYHEVGMLDGLGGDAPRPTDPVAWQAGIEIGRTLRKALAG